MVDSDPKRRRFNKTMRLPLLFSSRGGGGDCVLWQCCLSFWLWLLWRQRWLWWFAGRDLRLDRMGGFVGSRLRRSPILAAELGSPLCVLILCLTSLARSPRASATWSTFRWTWPYSGSGRRCTCRRRSRICRWTRAWERPTRTASSFWRSRWSSSRGHWPPSREAAMVRPSEARRTCWRGWALRWRTRTRVPRVSTTWVDSWRIRWWRSSGTCRSWWATVSRYSPPAAAITISRECRYRTGGGGSCRTPIFRRIRIVPDFRNGWLGGRDPYCKCRFRQYRPILSFRKMETALTRRLRRRLRRRLSTVVAGRLFTWRREGKK